MALTRLLTATAVATLLASQVLAQTAPPTPQQQRPATTQTQPARHATTPATPPATTQRPQAPAGQAQAARVNLNTANATELDSLPQIGAARAQAILTERAKGRFRDWADFERRMAGTSVNQTALTAIRERVRF
ncbi:ComEA family DNA-binding protein [Phreatobacter sp.]|uniref:ComEA family DNA-binding protein n=1 Tax=Phreatobacter sp. TaxID=1966341 RepID=UPI003F7115D7